MKPFLYFLGLVCLVVAVPSCTRPNDAFTGNAEAYTGARPRDGYYYWVDSRAACVRDGVTITGYRGVIAVSRFGSLKYKRPCDNDFTPIPDRDVKMSLFGKVPIRGVMADRILVFAGGLFDRLDTPPQAGSTSEVWTRALFQVRLGSIVYETVVRSQGNSESPVNAQAYVIDPEGTAVVATPVIASSSSPSTKTYLGTDYRLDIESGAGVSTATLETKIEGGTVSGTSTDGVDNALVAPPSPDRRLRLSVSGGVNFSCATRSGKAYCWGSNNNGMLGIGVSGNENVSHQTAIQGFSAEVSVISGGGTSACAIQDSALACWGANNLGQVGKGSVTAAELDPVFVPLPNPTALSVGNTHACAVSNRRVFCWGNNTAGQVGNGNQTQANSPTAVVGDLGDVVSVAAGSNFSCSLNSAGEAYCWGNNLMGQLGSGDVNNAVHPPQKIVGHKFVALVAKSYAACGITDAGKLLCWGDNNNAIVSGTGMNTPATYNTPTEVVGLSGPVTSASIGFGHACAIQSGTVYCWGTNAMGATGLGVTAGRSPVQPVGLNETAVSVSAGNNHTLVTTINAIYAWGGQSYGQLGNDSISNTVVSTPTRVNE